MAEASQMQRRLRQRRRLREDMLLDLGALVYELHRQGKRAPELLQEKAAELSAVDDEVRALEDALGGGGSPAPPAAAEQPTEDVEAAEEYVVSRLDRDAEGDDAELHEDELDEDEPAAEPQHAVAEAREPRP